MHRLDQDTYSLIVRTSISLTEFATIADIDRTMLYRIEQPADRAE